MVIGKLSSLPFTLKIILKDRYGPPLNHENNAVPRIEQTPCKSLPKRVEQDLISALTVAKDQALLVTCPLE